MIRPRREPMRGLRALAALATSATLLAALGCEKEKTTITVYPDGSGKIDYRQTLGKQISGFALMMAEGAEKKQEIAEQTLHKSLSAWEGVSAWTDAKAKVTDGEEIAGSAVGYFDDVTKLKHVEDAQTSEFKWTKTSDGFTLEQVDTPKKAGEGEAKKDPADSFLQEMPKEQLEMAVTMTTSMLEGLEIQRIVVMPGDVTEIAGAQKKDGRKATMTISDKELADLIKKGYTKGAELRKKIADGDITEEKARAEINDMFKDAIKPLKVTSKAGDTAAEAKENKKALEAAKKEFAGSELEKKIKIARENKPKMPGGGMEKNDDDDK
jgi:hypothetical protein